MDERTAETNVDSPTESITPPAVQCSGPDCARIVPGGGLCRSCVLLLFEREPGEEE